MLRNATGLQRLPLPAEVARWVSVAALDGRDRVWLGAGEELFLISGAGKQLARGTRGWLWADAAPVHGDIVALDVVNGGPSSLSTYEPATTTVVGKVTLAGKPVAGAFVELCPHPNYVSVTSPGPCDGQLYHYHPVALPLGDSAVSPQGGQDGGARG